MLCAFLFEAKAQNTGKIIVKGSFTDSLVICNVSRGVKSAERYFQYDMHGQENKTREFNVKDALDGERLFFSCNHDFTYLEIKAGGIITIELKKDGYKITGCNQEKNQYLYEFCHLAYGACSQGSYTSGLYNQIARTSVMRRVPVLRDDELFLKGDLKAISELENKCLKHLRKSNIKDSCFVAKQELLIKYLEEDLLLCDYSYARVLKYEIPENVLELLKTIQFTDEDLLQYPRVWIMVDNYCRYLKQENRIDFNVENTLARCAEKIGDPKVREAYLVRKLLDLIDRKASFNLLKIFDNCEPLLVSERGKDAYMKLRLQAEKMLTQLPAAGEYAYPFAYKNKENEIVRLSDFKGKYVLIDIWATWCGPCKAQMPYLKQLEEEMAGKNIVFVSICLNEPSKRQEWLDYIENNDMAGYCLMADNAFKDEMIVKYNIKAIPRFILVDPEGKLITAEAPQPREAAFREYLMNLVK